MADSVGASGDPAIRLGGQAASNQTQMYSKMEEAAGCDDPGQLILLSVEAQKFATLASIQSDMAAKGQQNTKDCQEAAYNSIK